MVAKGKLQARPDGEDGNWGLPFKGGSPRKSSPWHVRRSSPRLLCGLDDGLSRSSEIPAGRRTARPRRVARTSSRSSSSVSTGTGRSVGSEQPHQAQARGRRPRPAHRRRSWRRPIARKSRFKSKLRIELSSVCRSGGGGMAAIRELDARGAPQGCETRRSRRLQPTTARVAMIGSRRSMDCEPLPLRQWLFFTPLHHETGRRQQGEVRRPARMQQTRAQ
jgi:hypothetical protein